MASKSPPSTSQDRKKDVGKDTKGKAEKLTQEEQSARFKEAARELEADGLGAGFRSTLNKIVKLK